MAASIIYVDASGVQHSLTAINYGTSVAKSIYMGSTKVWTAPASATWIPITTSGNMYLATYTPTSAMSVASFSMTHSTNTTHNAVCGIWTLSGTTATPVTNACVSGTTGLVVTTGAVLGSNTQYTYTKTYTTKPALVAGTTYYFYVGDRYVTQSTLSGTAPSPGWIFDWSFSATASSTYTAANLGSVYLNVVAG